MRPKFVLIMNDGRFKKNPWTFRLCGTHLNTDMHVNISLYVTMWRFWELKMYVMIPLVAPFTNMV